MLLDRAFVRVANGRLSPIGALFAGCLLSCQSQTPTAPASDASPNADRIAASSEGAAAEGSVRSEPTADERLQIQLEIRSGVVSGRVPLRTAVLHFHNLSQQPVRIYLPQSEAFRTDISTLVFRPEDDGAPLIVPEPHPHGEVITEKDFPLIPPGETLSVPQQFTIDPIKRGGKGTERLAGFETGRTVSVRWTYENRITRWAGGAQTMDGPTQTLFGGKDIPWIWTGELATTLRWTVPP